MKFRTEIQLPQYKKLSSKSHILILGSCFSEHMYSFLTQIKLPLCYNPFGITYNPCSIASQITSLFLDIPPQLEQVQDSWYPFAHHGSFRKNTREETLKEMQETWMQAKEQLEHITDVFITLGSAYAWFRDGNVVNNCHKRPQKEFTRQLLNVDTIVHALQESCAHFSAQANITLTLSPIRHIRDGLVENSLSKSILRTSIHELQQQDSRIQYFPSFEIMMDDLRDYRFYESDLMHPSPMAIQYIFQHVRSALLDNALQHREHTFQKLHKRLQHKPLHPDTIEWTRFTSQTREALNECRKKYPHLDWSTEEEMCVQLESRSTSQEHP